MALKFPTRKTCWLFVAGVACIAVPFLIQWREAELITARARTLGSAPPVFFFEALVLGITTCFFIFFVTFLLAKIRLSLLVFMGVVMLAMVFGFLCVFVSAFIGSPPSKYFLDGFEARVSSSGLESNAIAWAENVFTNDSLNPNEEVSVQLSPSEIPAFFASVIGSIRPLEATVYYSKNERFPESLEIQAEEGMQWGIWIPKNSDTVPDWQGTKPRRVGNRMYVFIYYYK